MRNGSFDQVEIIAGGRFKKRDLRGFSQADCQSEIPVAMPTYRD